MDAGRKIWIASGERAGGRLQIKDCRPAAELPGSGSARDVALSALRAFIAEEREAAIGMDFPFGLPWGLVRGYASWEAFVADFPRRHGTPAAFRQFCRRASPGKELKREADRLARTPFAVYNLRLYRQTYFGIREILAPLLREGALCAPPVQAPQGGKAWVLETCPASTLKAMGLYRPYKGPGAARAAWRKKILAALTATGPLLIPARLRRRILADRTGDALDSLVAAFTAFRLVEERAPLFTRVSGRQALEAVVLVPSAAGPIRPATAAGPFRHGTAVGPFGHATAVPSPGRTRGKTSSAGGVT